MGIVVGLLIFLLIWIWMKSQKIESELREVLSKYTVLQKENEENKEKQKELNAELLLKNADIEKLKQDLAEAKKAVDFYKNITQDSGKLNVTDILKPDTLPVEDIYNLLDEEQRAVHNQMENEHANLLITGKAGTGKSFLLNAFRKTTGKNHLILAPTGIAALNVNGATLHSAFGYRNLVNLSVDQINEKTIQLCSEKRMVLKKASAIIIDEISMVRADTFDKIDKILKVLNENEMPFGGKQIFLFGDLFQLPPVAKKSERDYLIDKYGGIYFFCSDAFKNGNFKFIELTVNHRQKDDAEYFGLLNKIRENGFAESDIEVLNNRVIKDTSIYDRFTMLLPTKAEVEKVNEEHINQLDSPLFTFKAKILDAPQNNATINIETAFPILDTLKLKKGVLVMMVTNDRERRWVNGTLGIVAYISEHSIAVAINKRVYEISQEEFVEQEAIYENGKISYKEVYKVLQYPLILAYAITIHKSQGQTYQNIICDIAKCFTSGQAYVALSRCSSLSGLYLKNKINSSCIRVDPVVQKFYQAHLQ